MNDKLNEARIKSATIYLDSRRRLGTEPLPTVNQYDNSAESALQNALTTTKTRQQNQAEQVAQLEANSAAENTAPQTEEQAQLGYSGFTPDNEDALNMKREYRTGREYAGDFANAIASGGQRAYGSVVNTATIGAYGLRKLEEAFGGRGIVELQEALDQADEMTRVTATQNWLQQRKSEVSKDAVQELEAIRNDTSLSNSEQFAKTSEFYARNPTMAGIGIVESALGSFLEMAATGGLGKAVGLSGKAAVNAGMFTSGANAYIQDVQADGTATDATLGYGAVAGAGTALLGIGAKKLIGGTDIDSLAVNGVNSGRAGVKNWARGTVQEATEETPQNSGQGVLKQLENNQPWDEGLGINAAEGLILGAGSGGMMSAPSAVRGAAAAGVNKANTKMAERDIKKYGSSEENLDPTSDKFNPARAYNNALYELKSSDPTIRAAASELLARSTSTTYEELAKIDAEIAETTNETTKKDLMAKRTKFVDTQLQPLKAAVENHINASTQNKENFLLILKQYGEDKRKREEEAQATATNLSDFENEAQNNLNAQITERLKVVDTANYANELADFKGTDNSGSTVQIAANASEYTDLINSKAAQYGVPATLINAIVQTESEFNPNAKSSAGAVGLMQLMPGTAKDLKVSDRTNPEQNIDGGVRYIAQLLKRYNGDINNVLLAYNWGMGHVDAYLKTGKGKNGKAIPNEARQYAGKVKAAVNAINNGGQPTNNTQNSGKPLEGKLQGTDARISEVVMQAAKNLGIKVGVSEGLRSVEAQKKNVANGKSQTMNSKHLHGGAVDFHIIGADGKANWDFEAYRPLAEEAKRIAAEKGYEGFEWGGDWNTLKDGVHFQFKKGSENLNSSVSESTEVQPQAQDDDDTSSSPTIMPTDDVVANETTNTSESAAKTQQDAATEETQETDEAIDDGLIENTNTNPESEATSENTIELTPEDAAYEEYAMNQTRAFFSSMSNEEVDNHPLLSPADKTALKELLAFESTLQNSKSVEEVRREIEEGSKGATNRESNLGIQQYSDILRTAFASNDAKTASTYLDYLHRFANNSLSKSNAIAKANAEGATRENPIYLASNSDSTWVAVSPEEFAQANKEGRGTFAAIGENRGTKAIHEEAEMLTEAFEVYKKGGEALLQRPITLGNNKDRSTSSKTPITASSGSVGQDTGNQPIGTETSGFDAIERVDDGTDIPDDATYLGRYKRDGKTFSMGNIKSEEDIGTPGWLGSEHNESVPAKGMEKYIESFKKNADKYEAFIDELISMKGKKLLASPKASRLSEVGFLAELMTQLPTDRKEAAKFIQRIESYSPSKGITLGEEIEEEVPNAPVRTRHDIDETKERSAVPASKKAKVKGKARQGITTTNARNELSTNSYEETDSYTNSYSGESSSGNKHTFTIKREKGTNFIQSITHTVNGKVKKNSVQVTDNTVSDELLMSKLEKSLKAENEFEQDNLNTKKDDDSNITEYEGKVLPKELVEKTVKVTEAMKIYADTLEQDSISDTERALFTALINTLINFNPDMKVLIGKGNTENSYDAKTNTIKINLPMTDGSVMQEITRMVISVTTSKVANELEQLGSTDMVVDLTKMYDLNADLTNLRNTIDRVIRANDGRYNHLDDDVKIKILEAMKSNSTLLEMATTDLDIMTFLQSIKANEEKVKQSIFTKIVNSLKSFLNVGNTGKVSNQFDKLLEITVRTASEQARNKQVSFATSEDAKIHLFSGLDNTSLDILQAQEMQKNFYERNQLLAGFKQKSSKAKPLTSISDFTAKLKLDLMQGLQTLVSEAPTKAQREQVEDFLKFRDEIATHVKDTFRKKEGGKNPDTDYGYQDLKTYFMDDSGAINENVVTSVALAAYDWSIENGNKTMNMHKDLKKLLNLEVDDTVFIPPHIQEEYAYRGQLRPFVRAKLGKKAIDSLGIKANDTMSLEAQSRLENSMGEWVISAMQAADLIHINTMKSTDHFENIETVGGDLTGVDNINEAGQVSFVSITTPEGRDINPRLNEITTKNKGTINYLSKVFGMEIGLRAPFKKPPTDVMTKIKRTTAKMSLNQRRYVKKMQEEPISINKDMTDTLQNLLNSDRNITLEMIGAHVSESDLAKEHKNNRHSIQSAAEGVYRDLENGLDFVGSLNKINDNEYEPFYDAVYAAKNNRMHYNSNMFNFQSSKLQRSMGEYTNFKNDIDMTGIDGNDIAIYDTNGQISGAALFIRAIAESAEGTEKIMKAALQGSGIVDGFTVDKVDSELFVKPFFTYLTTDADVQTAVAAINKSLKGKQLSKDEVQSIAKVVKFWEGDANSLRALVEFTKFQNSLNNGDSTFTTSLGLGSDGINNGSAISYTLFGVGNDKFYTQVGLLLKDGRYGGLANYFQTRTDSTIGDYYTGFEEHINDAFGEQTDNQKMILELNTNFFKRKSFKAVLIPFGYSAGMPRLRALVFGQFLSDITSQFVALSKMDTNDENYTHAKNLMEVNLSNLIGETITLPEGKDILEFWFTPQQENALRKIYDKEIGAGVVKALEAYAAPFIAQRERNVKLQEAAYNTYALLKDVIIAKEVEKYIELLKHNPEYAELTDKQFESLYAAEGMPANYYKKHVQPKLDAIRPTVATPFNKDSTDWFDESDFDIPQESTTLKADKTSNSGTWKVNADGNLVGSNVSVAKAVRDEVSSGVMVNSAQVQGTDAMISARASAFGGNVNINVHDANISGLLNYVRMGLEQNKATFESLRDYHAQTHSLLAFSRSINSAKQLHKQGDITTEQLQDILIDSAIAIYGQETIDTYLSENGLDKEVSDKDIREKFIEPFITGIMADTLATEYRKFEQLSNMGVIHQYGGEGAQYTVTAEDLKGIDNQKVELRKLFNDIQTNFAGLLTEPKKVTNKVTVSSFVALFDTQEVYEKWSNTRDGTDLKAMQDQILDIANTYAPLITEDNKAEVMTELLKFKWFKSVDAETREKAINVLMSIKGSSDADSNQETVQNNRKMGLEEFRKIVGKGIEIVVDFNHKVLSDPNKSETANRALQDKIRGIADFKMEESTIRKVFKKQENVDSLISMLKPIEEFNRLNMLISSQDTRTYGNVKEYVDVMNDITQAIVKAVKSEYGIELEVINNVDMDLLNTLEVDTTEYPVRGDREIILTTNNKNVQPWMLQKDQDKSDEATRYLGFGYKNSSTDSYREAWGDLANIMGYTENDIVFVSTNGGTNAKYRIDPIKGSNGKPSPYIEHLHAIAEAGATIVMDDAKSRERPYNTGERAIMQYIKDELGYAEKTYGSGVWSPKAQDTGTPAKGKVTKEDVIARGWNKKPLKGVPNVEVSSEGDKRFSALFAVLKNGYSVEEMYQLFVKGYAETDAGKAYLKKRTGSIPGKRKAPIVDMTEEETYAGYKGMWRRYLNENPELLKELQEIRASGAILTDGFATTLNNQARALAELANEMEAPNSDSDTGQAPSIFKSINDVANNFRNLIANPDSSISEQRIKLFEYVMGRVKNHENNSNRVIKVAMVKDLNKNERGRFDVANNTIYINEDYVNATDTDGRMEVFLHETLHALTAVTIATNKTAEVKRAVHNLEVIRASLQLKAKQQGNNYLADVVFESVDEMVAYGMTDYDVQMFMRDNLKAKIPASSRMNADVGRANNGLIGFLKSVFSLFKQKNDTFEIFLRSADTVTTGYTDAQLSEYTGRAYHSSTSNPVETLKNLPSLNVSTEHNEHLDTIIDTTIADFLGESATNETVVTDVINKVSTRAITAGFKMSDKELHVMEIVKVISQAYLKDNAGSVTAKEVRKAHERAMNEITVNTFLTDPSTATKAERKQAQRKYDYVFKQDKLNKVEQLERFFSLALTSEDFKNTLTTLDNVKKKVSEKGLFDRLVKAFVNMLTWLTAKTLNTDGLNMSRELDILYKKLADVNKSARNNEANLFDKTYSFTTSIVTIPANFAANKIIDALFKVFNFGSASRVLAVRNISSSMAGMRTTGVGSVVNTYLGLNTSATSVDGSNRLNGFGELLYELGRNTGMKGVVESIIRATNKAGQLRQSVVQATKSALAKEFTDFDKVGKAKLDSLTKVVLRTDMSALLDNGVNVNRVVKLLRNSKERRAEIAKHEAFIATYANHNDILLQTKALGYYMATEVAPEHLVKNAEGIAIGKDSWYEVDISLMDISLRNSIDQLASLYAVEATKKQDRDLLEQLITEQPEAIKAVLKHHLEMVQRSKKDFKDNMPNYVKGYMPQKTHELRSLKFAETEKEVKKLEAQGWEIITEDGIAQDTSDNSDARVLMFHNDMLYQDYVSGALDMKDTHAKGTMVYSVATDLSEVNRVKREKLRSRRERNATVHSNYNFAKQKGGNLIASYNASGELTGYHYEMSGRLRDTYLERDNNAIELLGIYNSNLAFKPEVVKTQQTLAQELHKDFVNSYANDPRQFVTLDPESKDPNVVAMWRMMPYAFRKEAETLFGKGKPIVVRNTIYNTVFGFRTYSMSEMFEKVNGERNPLENFIVSIMTAISGDKAQMRMLQGERLWQKGISQMKDFIVIRNYKVLIGNIVSNSLLLSLEGITPSQQIKDFISVWRNGGMYRKLAARVLEIDSEIALNKGRAQVISRLNRERNVALNEMQNNPMHEFMEAGLMSSIVEDTNVYKEDSGYKSDLDKKIDKLTENIPEQVVTAFNWALMSPGTPMHNFMAHSTQFSDLAAKYSLIKHRMAKGDSQSKAIAAAQDAFINYDVPTGKGLDYMNKMGLFMFTKFIIRFQQAIARQLNKRAGSAVAQHLAVEELTNVSGVLEPFILNRFGNPFQAGLLNYGDAFGDITTVHFVKSMF